MPGRQDDASLGLDKSGGSAGRGYLLVLAALLVLGAVGVVFVSADLLYLRLAVLAGGCAFVLAAMVAAQRRRQQVVAAGREADLRRSFDRELEREGAAHREAELELENDLRREAEESMRAQLATLRAEVASLTELRQEVARMTALRDELSAVAAFRDDLAALSALRRDVTALAALRDEVGQLGELRADVGRLRAELTEQLNGEMLVERIVMRTQATRMPADQGPDAAPRTVESRALGSGSTTATSWGELSWSDEPPRELTGGWPAVRLDEPPATREYERTPAERTGAPQTRTPLDWLAEHGSPAPARPEAPARPDAPARPAHRHAAAEPSTARPPAGRPAQGGPTPPEWFSAGAFADPPLPPVPPRRRRTDGPPAAAADPAEAVTTAGLQVAPEHPSLPLWRDAEPARPAPSAPTEPPAAPTPPVPAAGKPAEEPEPAGHARLTEILAENGVTPASGGRRRRRYRDENEPDDVLARVLGR